MPAKDMSLEQLKQYNGSSPCPGDFWDFWDRQKKRAWDCPLRYRLEKAEIPSTERIEFYDLWVEGVNGDDIHAKYIRPVREDKIPVALQFHGYPGAARGWFELSSLAGAGYAVLVMECTGQGGSSFNEGKRAGTMSSDHIVMGLDGPVENMYYVEMFLNTCLMVRIALDLPEINAGRIYVNGASQGAALGLVCTALNPAYIKRCIALYPFLSDYKRAWDMDRDLIVYDGLRYYGRYFDPAGVRRDEMFMKLGYIDVQNFVERITCPVLFGTGLLDDICPPSTQFAVYHKIRAPKRHFIFPEYSHEEIGYFDDVILEFLGEEDDGSCLEQI